MLAISQNLKSIKDINGYKIWMDIDNKVVNYWITKSLNKNYQTSLVKSGTTATIPQKV